MISRTPQTHVPSQPPRVCRPPLHLALLACVSISGCALGKLELDPDLASADPNLTPSGLERAPGSSPAVSADSGACSGLGLSGPTDPLLDDFLGPLDYQPAPRASSNEPLIGAGWLMLPDGTPGSFSSPPAGADALDREGNRFVSARGQTSWGFNYSLLLNQRGTSFCPVNLEQFDGLRFRLQSPSGNGIPVYVGATMHRLVPPTAGGPCAGDGCFDVHRKEFTVGRESVTVDVLWSELSQDLNLAHANKLPFDPSEIVELHLGAKSDVTAEGVTVILEEVSLFRVGD